MEFPKAPEETLAQRIGPTFQDAMEWIQRADECEDRVQKLGYLATCSARIGTALQYCGWAMSHIAREDFKEKHGIE